MFKLRTEHVYHLPKVIKPPFNEQVRHTSEADEWTAEQMESQSAGVNILAPIHPFHIIL